MGKWFLLVPVATFIMGIGFSTLFQTQPLRSSVDITNIQQSVALAVKQASVNLRSDDQAKPKPTQSSSQPNSDFSLVPPVGDATAEAQYWDGLGKIAAREFLRISSDGEAPAEAERAISLFQKALAADPAYLDAHYHIGLILAKQRKCEKALEEFETILAVEPANFKALIFAGQMKEYLTDTAGALILYKKAWVPALTSTYQAKSFYETSSPWLDIDVKGKGVYNDKFFEEMTGCAIDIQVIWEFEETRLQKQVREPTFSDNEYMILRGVLPPLVLKRVQKYFSYLEAVNGLGFDGGPKSGGQAIRKTGFNERVARLLQSYLTPMVARLTARPVKPSYSFMGIYIDGADLFAHKDNLQCEFTMSLTFDSKPEGFVWPIYVCPQRTYGDWKAPCPVDDLPIFLNHGDALLFMGRYHSHRRAALPPNHSSSSVFLHYVDMSFKGGLNPGDPGE